MSENSAIEWTDHTFNPWWGCTKISAGCTHCYADTLSTRYGQDVWGPKAQRRFASVNYWKNPIKWNKAAEAEGQRKRVFCASMSDVFERHMIPNIQSMMNLERAHLWEVIEQTPMLDWLLLTKRPENIRDMIPTRWLHDVPQNVWYGTSTEDQEQADKRIPELLKVPAAVRFLSAEPLLGPIDLGHYLIDDWTRIGDDVHWHARPPIHWIITGGESGNGARPCDPQWVRDIRDQCVAANVAFFHKQWGGRIAKSNGRTLDGQIWSEFPEPQTVNA